MLQQASSFNLVAVTAHFLVGLIAGFVLGAVRGAVHVTCDPWVADAISEVVQVAPNTGLLRKVRIIGTLATPIFNALLRAADTT